MVNNDVLETYDGQSMETMMKSHNKLKKAIESREADIDYVQNFGLDLKESLTIASDEIDKMLELMNIKFLLLFVKYDLKQSFINQIYLYKDADLQSSKIQNQIEYIKNGISTAMCEVLDVRTSDQQMDPEIGMLKRKSSKCTMC